MSGLPFEYSSFQEVALEVVSISSLGVNGPCAYWKNWQSRIRIALGRIHCILSGDMSAVFESS